MAEEANKIKRVGSRVIRPAQAFAARRRFRIMLAAIFPSDQDIMPKRRKKKIERPVHLSAGPLPSRLAGRFADRPLVFSDASLKRHGGLAAVIFADPEAPPQVATQTVPATGSHALELQAALFALATARRQLPVGSPLALFSDNQDAMIRLGRAGREGLAADAELAGMLGEGDGADALAGVEFVWIKGHGSCRGNDLADRHAAAVAV